MDIAHHNSVCADLTAHSSAPGPNQKCEVQIKMAWNTQDIGMEEMPYFLQEAWDQGSRWQSICLALVPQEDIAISFMDDNTTIFTTKKGDTLTIYSKVREGNIYRTTFYPPKKSTVMM